MICAQCQKEGLRSTITSDGGGWTTLMAHTPWYDEDGNYHSHDPNSHGDSYRCSNGHAWSRSWLSKCPSCNYGREG